MEGYFELTRDKLAAAKTYMPLQTKRALANEVARASIRPMKQVRWNGIHIIPDEDYDADKDPTALPDLMEEDVALKNALLLNILLGYYLDIEINPEDGADEIYDYYAGGHLLNQIERFKSDRELKNIAFDLMDDFREFKKMVDTIIFNQKQNANDPLKRFDAMLTVFSTPDNIKAMIDRLQKDTDELTGKVQAENARRKAYAEARKDRPPVTIIKEEE